MEIENPAEIEIIIPTSRERDVGTTGPITVEKSGENRIQYASLFRWIKRKQSSHFCIRPVKKYQRETPQETQILFFTN